MIGNSDSNRSANRKARVVRPELKEVIRKRTTAGTRTSSEASWEDERAGTREIQMSPKSQRVELGGPARKFERLTRGDLSGESWREVSRGRSSKEAG